MATAAGVDGAADYARLEGGGDGGGGEEEEVQGGRRVVAAGARRGSSSSSLSSLIDDLSDEEDLAQATVASTVFGLSNNVCGAGLLSLAWCDKEASILEGSLLVAGVGVLSGLSLVLVAVCCDLTGCFTFRGMGEHVLGHGFGVALQATMMVYTFLSCVSFMILAGDFFSGPDGIPAGLCPHGGGCQWAVDLFATRFRSVLVLTVLLLCPLSSMRRLDALRFTSLLSMGGMLYLLGLVVAEYASADAAELPGGIQWATPSWGVFSAAPIINVAFIAHYNVPRFYQEMHERSVEKFAKAVGISLGLCGCVYLLLGVFGYLRFGDATKSDVLSNFEPGDTAAILGKLAMSGVVLFTYPLAFNSHRGSAIALLAIYKPSFDTRLRSNFLALTYGLIALTFVLGSTLTDIGIVLDYKGASLGGCIAFAFPGWMFLARVCPDKVQWCCIRPHFGQAASSEAAGEQPLVGPAGSSALTREDELAIDAKLPELARKWQGVAQFFFVYALLMGVAGVTVTTLKLLDIVDD